MHLVKQLDRKPIFQFFLFRFYPWSKCNLNSLNYNFSSNGLLKGIDSSFLLPSSWLPVRRLWNAIIYWGCQCGPLNWSAPNSLLMTLNLVCCFKWLFQIVLIVFQWSPHCPFVLLTAASCVCPLCDAFLQCILWIEGRWSPFCGAGMRNKLPLLLTF